MLRALCRRVLYRHHAGHRHDHRDGQHPGVHHPNTLGQFFPLIVGIIGMPASLLFDPDSFYYGVLPVLAQTAEGFGVVGADVGRAAILGQMTVGFPVSPLTASTFLLVGLSGVDFGEHQKKTIPLAWLVSLVMVAVAILTRGIAI